MVEGSSGHISSFWDTKIKKFFHEHKLSYCKILLCNNMSTYNYIYIKALLILTIKIYFRIVFVCFVLFFANQINTKQSWFFFTKSLRRPAEKDQIVMKLH